MASWKGHVSCEESYIEYSSLINEILRTLCFKGLVDAVHGLPVVPRSTFSLLDFQPKDMYGNIVIERSWHVSLEANVVLHFIWKKGLKMCFKLITFIDALFSWKIGLEEPEGICFLFYRMIILLVWRQSPPSIEYVISIILKETCAYDNLYGVNVDYL